MGGGGCVRECMCVCVRACVRAVRVATLFQSKKCRRLCTINLRSKSIYGFLCNRKSVSVDEKKEKERKKETQTNAASAKLRPAAHFARLTG